MTASDGRLPRLAPFETAQANQSGRQAGLPAGIGAAALHWLTTYDQRARSWSVACAVADAAGAVEAVVGGGATTEKVSVAVLLL